MPGLLRGVARTAVIAGTATALSNRASRRQTDGRLGAGRAATGPGDHRAGDDNTARRGERTRQVRLAEGTR